MTHRPVDKNTKKSGRTCDSILLDDCFLMQSKVSISGYSAPGLAIHAVDLLTDGLVRLVQCCSSIISKRRMAVGPMLDM